MGAMAPRFVADAMVGKLAKWLRAFGFDVFYHPFADDEELITVARERGAILLTRDTRLQEVRGVRTIFIEDDHVGAQLRQVAREAPLDLREARPLTRCTACNGVLQPAARGEVWERIPPFIYLTQERYAVCPDCGRVYWEGTHVARLREKLAELARHTGEAA
jgi:uncharacterized protein with PIN domain